MFADCAKDILLIKMLKKEKTGRHTAEKHKNIPTINENNKTNMLINDGTRLEAILKLSDVIFLMLDKDWNIMFLNEKGHEILGVKDVVGKNYQSMLRGQIKDESILSFKKFLDFESGERNLRET